MATEAEWAWVAGIVEGEGWISAVEHTSTAVVVEMTDEDIVRRLHTVSAVGTFRGPLPVTAPTGKSKYRWGVYGKTGLTLVLSSILPWLGNRRTERAVALLTKIKDRVPKVRGLTRERRLAQKQAWRDKNRERIRTNDTRCAARQRIQEIGACDISL